MTPDESLWQRLEADFARVLGEIPKPEGPEPVFVRAADGTYYAFEKAQERGEYGEARET